MGTKIRNHDLRSVNSGTVYLPPNAEFGNLQIPSLHETSTTQLYDLGTKYVFNDKVFKHFRTNTGGSLSAQRGAMNQNAIVVAYTTLSYPVAAAPTVAAAVGATSVYVVKAGVAKDDYKYGHVILGHNSDATCQNRGIIGNDASATVAGVANVVKIDLEFPLHTALVAGTSGIEVMKSIYGNVAQGTGVGVASELWKAVVCVPCIYIATTALEYFWGQTWGPVWLTPGAAGYGATASERLLVFDGYGSVQDFTTVNITGVKGYQIAGFLLDSTVAPEDCSFVMLQISP